MSEHDAAENVPFTGVGVALLTFFDEALNVNYSATAQHATRLVDLGMRAVLVAGTSGEAHSLTDDERVGLVEQVGEQVNGRALVIAGVVAATTEEACRLTERTRAAGANCFLSAVPKEQTPLRHYEQVAAIAAGLPVLAYHHPKRFPPGLKVDAIDSLPVAGLKDSSGDASRLLDSVTRAHKPFYTGATPLLYMCAATGGVGAISGAANAFPELAVKAFEGDAEAQRELHIRLDAARDIPFPGKLKRLTCDRFQTPPAFR